MSIVPKIAALEWIDVLHQELGLAFLRDKCAYAKYDKLKLDYSFHLLTRCSKARHCDQRVYFFHNALRQMYVTYLVNKIVNKGLRDRLENE